MTNEQVADRLIELFDEYALLIHAANHPDSAFTPDAPGQLSGRTASAKIKFFFPDISKTGFNLLLSALVSSIARQSFEQTSVDSFPESQQVRAAHDLEAHEAEIEQLREELLKLSALLSPIQQIILHRVFHGPPPTKK